MDDVVDTRGKLGGCFLYETDSVHKENGYAVVGRYLAEHKIEPCLVMGALFVYVSFLLICCSAIFRPSIGMLGYIGYVALVPHWLWRFSLPDVTFPFQKYIAVCTLLGFLLTGMRGVPLSRTAVQACTCLTAFVAISFASSFQSIAPDKSWFFMDVIYKITLMVCVACRVIDSEQILKWAVVFVIVGIGWNAYEINLDYFSRGFSTINQDGWAYQNANGYALVLILGISLTISAALHTHWLPVKLALLFIACLDIHAIYIVEARGAMLGCLLTGLGIVYLMEKNAANWSIVSSGAVVALAMAGPSVIREFSSSFSENLDHSAESRFYIWEAGLRISLDNPLLGVGPWAAEHLVPQYYQDPSGWKPERLHLHNLPLEVSTGMGIPAAILYVAFFLIPLRNIYKINSSQSGYRSYAIVRLGVLSGVPGYWLASMFNSGALIEVPYLCMILAISVSNLAAQQDASTPLEGPVVQLVTNRSVPVSTVAKGAGL